MSMCMTRRGTTPFAHHEFEKHIFAVIVQFYVDQEVTIPDEVQGELPFSDHAH